MTKKAICRAALLVAALLRPLPAAAAENAVPSCFAATGIGTVSEPPTRAVFLFVDQTTALDAPLATTVRGNMQRLLRPGTSFTVATFSAFQRGHYTTILTSGTIELPVPASRRASLPTNRLHRLDACLRQQTGFAARLADSAFAEASRTSAATFSQSEIMASLKQLSGRVAAAPVRDRIVIVASDMLEHSSATSFYRNRGLRAIDAIVELRRAIGQRLTGDFAGARVYVVGAGLMPPQQQAAIRDIRALNALESFWAIWFRQSNARLIAFGHPDLVTPIQ